MFKVSIETHLGLENPVVISGSKHFHLNISTAIIDFEETKFIYFYKYEYTY